MVSIVAMPKSAWHDKNLTNIKSSIRFLFYGFSTLNVVFQLLQWWKWEGASGEWAKIFRTNIWEMFMMVREREREKFVRERGKASWWEDKGNPLPSFGVSP